MKEVREGGDAANLIVVGLESMLDGETQLVNLLDKTDMSCVVCRRQNDGACMQPNPKTKTKTKTKDKDKGQRQRQSTKDKVQRLRV